MSTGTAFQILSESDLTQALCDILEPRLREHIRARAAGHCMRVANLDLNLMIALCQRLRHACPDAQLYILKENGHQAQDDEAPELLISSTKLVELRNPLPGGSLRPPLLVFLPANLQASAEDSFGIATFEDIPVTDVYASLCKQLLENVPSALQGYVSELLTLPQSEWWPWADQVDGESLGASLYELGLVPDFQLFADPALMQSRLSRNRDCVRTLTYSDASLRGRVLELGLSDKTLQKRLIDFLSAFGGSDPHQWTRHIVIDREYHALSFDKWQFVDELKTDKIAIRVLNIDIPEVSAASTDKQLEDLSGQKVLNPNQQTKFNLVFSVDPLPANVPTLDHFTVQIFTKEGEPVGGAKRVKKWTSKKAEQTVQLDKLNKMDFEDGWHFVRVRPWTKDDEPVPLTELKRTEYSSAQRSNESEPFYVLREGEILDPPQRATPLADSVAHAKLLLQFRTLAEQHDPASIKVTQVEWIEKVSKASKARQGQQEVLEVRFERGGKFHISVSRHLRTLEQRILASPRVPAHWSWHINQRASSIGEPLPDHAPLPKSPTVTSFLDARQHYFQTICTTALGQDAILQGVDLEQLAQHSIEYAEAYRDLLTDLARKIEQSRGTDQQRAILALRTVLAIDTVHLSLIDIRGRTKEAALFGPTHPLRALWFATWVQVGQQWLAAAQNGPEEYIMPVREALLRDLVPLNIPATLPNTDGRVFIMVDMLNPFWSLYAPPSEEDIRGLLGEVCTLLGLPEPAISGESISAEVLEKRIARYLVQHPYVRTLNINAFNPGRAEVIAQTLLRLQKQEAFSDLHYDLRLFVPDPATPSVGEAVEALLTPSAASGAEGADIFALPGNSHLFPKLSLAIHKLTDFAAKPHAYRAHLSMLFDLFPAEAIGAGPVFNPVEMTPLYGLMQDFATRFEDSEAGTFWHRQPRHGRTYPLSEEDGSSSLLADLSGTLSGMVATIATSSAAFEQRPIITLSLTTAQRELLHYVHEISDWVLTIDRNIGIEFFDHGGQRGQGEHEGLGKRDERPAYLIDYTPGSTTGSGHQLITTSRALLELQATLLPLLQQHELTSDSTTTTLLLDQLRALSGRLALKLISSTNHQTEALGLALARLFLLQQGALSNQIILPLDAHLDLFYSAKQASEEVGEAITLQRTDLALFDLNATTRTIRCNLVEVKCYSSVGGAGAYAQLKQSIAEQLTRSEEVLRHHFDPLRKRPDRPDRLLKTRELTTLLAFYLGRSRRYGLMRPDVDTEAQTLLATLEDGYTLHFTRCALIFDFEQPGIEFVDVERGIEFYRIGQDQVTALLAATPAAPATAEHPVSRSSQSFSSAAFLAPERDHSVSRDYYAGTSLSHPQPAYEEEPEPPSFRDEPAPPTLEEAPPSTLDEPTPPAVDVGTDVSRPQAEEEQAAADEPPTPIVPVEKVAEAPSYSYMLGVAGKTPQYGILGEIIGKKVALDLNQTHTISLFGVQGSGKSYTLGSIVEMACLPIAHINVLPSPLATVIFHYSPTQDYKPEFTTMVYPNSEEQQLAQLRERYGAAPQALRDVVLLAPTAKVAERKREYPDIEVLPITFAAAELKAVHWKFLMNAVGSQSMYIRQIMLIMKKLRDQLTLEGLRQEIANSSMSEHLKNLAQDRLLFAEEYIDDRRRLTDVIRPGRLLIVDVRDEFIEKDQALGLFVVLLQIFSEATYQGKTFNKLVVFDEAHKYIESPDLVAGLIEVVREMRHKGTSILVASQDPPSVPVSLIELSTQIILHRCNSPAWLKHIQKANSALSNLTPDRMSHLGSGEAYVWSAKASDDSFTRDALKIRCRPRVTQHGGSTKTAVQ
jgi:DNA phosphorothioation-dependent restriction protein DptH